MTNTKLRGADTTKLTKLVLLETNAIMLMVMQSWESLKTPWIQTNRIWPWNLSSGRTVTSKTCGSSHRMVKVKVEGLSTKVPENLWWTAMISSKWVDQNPPVTSKIKWAATKDILSKTREEVWVGCQRTSSILPSTITKDRGLWEVSNNSSNRTTTKESTRQSNASILSSVSNFWNI